MEYEIYSESLVYYALKNEQGYWSCIDGDRYYFSYDMVNIEFFPTIKEAKEIQSQLKDETEIRKVKVIDIGRY